jgi:hypothetical protein
VRVKRSALGVAALLLVLLLSALAPAGASARVHRAKTRLLFDTFGIIYSDGSLDWAYVGVVESRSLRCWGGRRVSFYRKGLNSDTLIGSTRSDFIGEAVLIEPTPDLSSQPGKYYAKVRLKRRRTRHGRLRCSGDRSNTVTVSAPQFLSPKTARARVGALDP